MFGRDRQSCCYDAVLSGYCGFEGEWAVSCRSYVSGIVCCSLLVEVGLGGGGGPVLAISGGGYQSGIANSERDGTYIRKEGETKGKQGNGVGNPAMERERQVIACPSTTTLPSSG
jgi:hypothetical protein